MVSNPQIVSIHARLRLLALAAAALAVSASGPALQAQALQRQAYVSAFDPAGVPVESLDPADISIREDGVSREVLRIVKATAPMQVAVLIDNSQAAEPSINQLRQALRSFGDALAGENQVALITYGERPKILTEYTREAEQLRQGVGRLWAVPESGAYMLDAIIETTAGLRKRAAERPVIVVIGVEGPEFSTRHQGQVLDAIRETGAAFHVVFLSRVGADQSSDEIQTRNIVIARGTTEFGGRRDELLTVMALEQKLKEVARELSSQYLVTYARPQTLIPPEKIEITSAKPDRKLRGTPIRVPPPAR